MRFVFGWFSLVATDLSCSAREAEGLLDLTMEVEGRSR